MIDPMTQFLPRHYDNFKSKQAQEETISRISLPEAFHRKMWVQNGPPSMIIIVMLKATS